MKAVIGQKKKKTRKSVYNWKKAGGGCAAALRPSGLAKGLEVRVRDQQLVPNRIIR